ncbi:MAG: IS200/IS605 family transposase [Methanosarcina sp.]
MAYIKILIHVVWTTKNRQPFLTDQIRNDIIFHIKKNAISKDIHIDHINGYTDHLHALISFGNNQTVSQIMQLIKGESSFWINKSKLSTAKFEWQDDYYAVSIGMTQLEILRNYIKNQEQHHKVVLLEDELELLIKEYGLKRIKD